MEMTVEKLFTLDLTSLLESAVDYDTIGKAVTAQLQDCAAAYSSKQHERYIEQSNIVLDFVWEKLNQGNWKDVDINWRYAYSLVSTLKALSEYKLFMSGSSSISFAQVVKTCDMGLLMGAPVCDNFLRKVCRCLQSDHTEKYSSTIKHKTEESPQQQDTGRSNTRKQAPSADDTIEPLSKKLRPEDIDLPVITESKQIPRMSCPSLETFIRDYLNTKYPVIITYAMNHWPALSTRKWSLDYIKEKAGLRTVPIELGSKYTDETWSQKLMTIGQFIDSYIDKRDPTEGTGYLAQHQLFDQVPDLHDGIVFPDYCYLGNDPDNVDINAWFGPSGTISPLHFDPKHNFLAQVIGKKHIRIYADSKTEKLYPHSTTLLKNTSQVDIENIDTEKFPLVQEASFAECVLQSGEILYMPPKFWHFVKSLSLSFSVSFWWE